MTLGTMNITIEDRLEKLEKCIEEHKQCLTEIKNYLIPNDAKSIIDNARKEFGLEVTKELNDLGSPLNRLETGSNYPPIHVNYKDATSKQDIESADIELKRKIDKLVKSSDPYRLNKIYELQEEFNKKYGVTSTHKPNGVLNQPNLEHYYEDGMPRLDRYLAYVQVDNRSKPGGSRELYLLSNCCEISVCKRRHAVSALDTVTVNLVGLMHVETMTMVDLKIILNGRENLEMSLYNMLNKLTNNGELTSTSIYRDITNQFRTIDIEIEKDEMSMRIINTIYSSYGCMEENEPMWEDTIKGSACVVII